LFLEFTKFLYTKTEYLGKCHGKGFIIFWIIRGCLKSLTLLKN